MDKLNTLYEMCETISRELESANEKVRKAGGELSAGDVDYIDKLTHALKSIKCVISMMEDEGEYSNRATPMYQYNDGRGGSYRSYARNRKRDSMGRYSSEGYSRAESEMSGLLDEMRGMMNDLPEHKRMEVQRFIDKMQ